MPFAMLEWGKMKICVGLKYYVNIAQGWGEWQNAYRMTFPTLVTKVRACIIYAAFISVSSGEYQTWNRKMRRKTRNAPGRSTSE